MSSAELITDGRVTSVARSSRWPELDGLRAIAVLAVMALHAGVPHMAGGLFGVDVFFALSGFLITTILLREWDRTGSIRLRGFYERRARRLLPALALVTIAVVIFVKTFATSNAIYQDQSTATLWGLRSVWLYVGNWAELFHYRSWGLGLLDHTWSLAIEEQFYLIWPFVLIVLIRQKINRTVLAVATFVVATLLATWGWLVLLLPVDHIEFRAYLGTDTHSSGLMLGCALGLWLSVPRRTIRHPAILFSVGATLVGVPIWRVANAFTTPAAWDFYLVSLGASMVILAVVDNPPRIAAILRVRPLRYIGRISYGLYLWHYPIYIALGELAAVGELSFLPHHSVWCWWLLEASLPLACAVTSYHVVEKRFLALGNLSRRVANEASSSTESEGVPSPSGVAG